SAQHHAALKGGATSVAAVAASDQVKQREEENPDDIDKVPVQAGDLYRVIPVRRKPAAPRHDQKHREDSYPDHHVQRVHARHGKVEEHEELDVGERSAEALNLGQGSALRSEVNP